MGNLIPISRLQRTLALTQVQRSSRLVPREVRPKALAVLREVYKFVEIYLARRTCVGR